MDKQYQDIHYISRYEEFVCRGVEVKQIRFCEMVIEIDYEIAGKAYTLVLLKLIGSKLVID